MSLQLTPPLSSKAQEHDFLIEGLRGMAALMVVYAHYWQPAGWTGGPLAFAFSGVDLFFVLSGYVFAPYFTGRPLHLPSFWLRRCFRIYPVYGLGLVFYAALRDTDFLLILKHLLMIHTWEGYQTAFSLNPAFWSLPPEMEFYLVLPGLALVGRRGLPWLLLGAVALRLGLCLALPTQEGAVNWALRLSAHLPGVLAEFLMGAWVALLGKEGRSGPARGVAAVLAGLLLAGLAQTYAQELADQSLTDGHAKVLTMGAAAGYALLVWSVAGLRPQSTGVRTICLALGALSFGVYVFHNGCLSVVHRFWPDLNPSHQGLFALVACVVLSSLVYRVLESPARSLGRRLGDQWARSALQKPHHA